jgi:hypothetical protein
MFEIASHHTITASKPSPAVELALKNLKRDFAHVTGVPLESTYEADADLRVLVDTSLRSREEYRITIASDKIIIAGADELGLIFGIYKFTEVALGVEPLWFWKDNYPKQDSVNRIEEQMIHSPEYTFKYRGWFINDEDLLSDWQEPAGKRCINYPYYGNVVALEVMDAVYEAALRSGTNLIIPASFVDIFNPPERALVEKAVASGLYVTQHHVEPLGVSHFTFEVFWQQRGGACEFCYSAQREKVLEAWATYVREWVEIAGTKVVWQLGLRGKGDSSAWCSDPNISRENAGEFISNALADQIRLINAIDKRENPPMTLTLWLEMSDLMAGNALVIPDSVIRVFSDDAKRQILQDDFYGIERKASSRYGAYLHTAYWINGAHAIPGVHPARLQSNFYEVALRGDTDYAIVNVCNIREHVIGIQAASELMCDLPTWRLSEFMERYGGEFIDEYQRYYEAFCQTADGTLQDGQLWLLVKQINQQVHNHDFSVGGRYLQLFKLDTPSRRRNFILQLEGKIKILESIMARRADARNTHHAIQLFYFSEWLLRIYQILISSLQSFDAQANTSDTLALLDEFLEFRSAAEQGKWRNWYRGDRKTDWRAIRDSLRADAPVWLEWSA